MTLIATIRNHVPSDDQEAQARESFLQFLTTFPEGRWAVRQNLIGHLTASAWVVNPDRSKVVFAFHDLYQSWAWLGGHADGDTDLLRVAQKEAKEESSLDTTPVSSLPFYLAVDPVQAHVKRGMFVPAHLHFNAVYLMEADESAALAPLPGENSAVAWMPNSLLLDSVSEEHIKPDYAAIMKKVAKFR
jgi:8-oxo-dGTP pyrophosphatase MutT (NUDIX family)